MPTIKGPIKISGGFNSTDFLKEHAGEIKIKLPFTATNFKSSKTPANVDLDGMEMGKGKPKESKPKESQKDDRKKFKEELIELNGVGAKSAEIIVKMARNKTELRRVPRKTLIDELRDDVVEVLDGYLGK